MTPIRKAQQEMSSGPEAAWEVARAFAAFASGN